SVSSLVSLLGATPPAQIYTLSLHDALPILGLLHGRRGDQPPPDPGEVGGVLVRQHVLVPHRTRVQHEPHLPGPTVRVLLDHLGRDRKSTRLNSSHVKSSYAVFCLKKKKNL